MSRYHFYSTVYVCCMCVDVKRGWGGGGEGEMDMLSSQ